VIYLNEKALFDLADYNELISVIEKSMSVYEEKRFVMPDRISVSNGNETYLYMPCFTDEVKGTKILTIYPNNAQIDIPTIQGVVLLNDNRTGKIRCIMDGAALTALRTGAVGAAGIKHTTNENCQALGVVGTGVQGFYQCVFAAKVRDIKKINVFNRSVAKAEAFKQRLNQVLGNTEINVCDNTEKLIEASEIIITATTSFEPVLPDDGSLLVGKHFIGIGSYKPQMREYPKALFDVVERVFVDIDYAKEESGDLCKPLEEHWISEDKISTLGSIIGKEKPEYGTTLYKSVGGAIFDVYVGDYFMNKAEKNGIGQILF